ncbi:uracil DNA glycosylase [Proboscivirus elephantidbeta4]|uniref:Uracil DNA glycosylase n=1 Tax=Elephant endotheliotropic herpesvirus 4 TaxID=548914 RepID=A0A0S1TKU8_9BETA|nr:uracil DNA glycosylase [Elephant endotheliotropic herpesvirus 4]ALM26027.1 uracil DNA glycosylase [Elephant endotheliotropic herpesvirus 4]
MTQNWIRNVYSAELETAADVHDSPPSLSSSGSPARGSADGGDYDIEDSPYRIPKRPYGVYRPPNPSYGSDDDGVVCYKKPKLDQEQHRQFPAVEPNKLDPVALFKKMHLNEEWVAFLEFTEFDVETLTKVQTVVETHRVSEIVYPPPINVHRWSHLCAPRDVKVVIVGQDPYPQPRRADGLAFSTGDGAVAPSLRNIYRELQRSIEGFRTPNHGHLDSWARQGVLLLNTAFTVIRGVPGSHSNLGWRVLSDRVITQLSKKTEGLVFLLWGNHAKEKAGLVDKSKHAVFTSAHPSPLAAARNATFVGNDHFVKANQYLVDHGRNPVNWNSLNDGSP